MMLLEHAHIISPGVDLPDVSVRVRDGRVAAVGRDLVPEPGEEMVDLHGQYLAPGFIDIHTHGRSGHDFCDLTDAAFDVMGRDRLADGVTGFLATGLTRPESDLAEMCRCAERYKAKGAGATCLGVHLEGPFFNPTLAGAQNPA